MLQNLMKKLMDMEFFIVQMEIYIKENGKKVIKKDMGFIIILVVINMKENGIIIK